MKYVKIYDSKMMPCGVIDLDGSFPSLPTNKFVKAYDNNNKFVGVLELGVELTESQSSLTVHLYDENLNLCGNVPAHIIEKDVPNPNIILTPSSFTYSGEPCVPTVVVKDGDKVVPTSEYTVEITNNVNAGTALVTITDKVGGDYKVSGTTTFQIAKVTSVYTAPTGKENLEYTGEAQALLNAGSTSDGTIKYSLDGTNWGTSVPTGTEAQTYTVYWKLEGDANHSDVSPTTISVEIATPQTPQFEVWANEECTQRPDKTNPYGTLYIKCNTVVNQALSLGGGNLTMEWSDELSKWTLYLYIDWEGECGNYPIPAGSVLEVTTHNPNPIIPNNAPLDFYLE